MRKNIYWSKRWRALRLEKLASRPYCEVCERRGMRVPATAVDHKRSIASGGDPFPPLCDLMSMCARCHNAKTAARDNPHAFGDGSSLAFQGCGEDGLPIDAEHPYWGHSPPSKLGPTRLQPTSQVSTDLISKKIIEI